MWPFRRKSIAALPPDLSPLPQFILAYPYYLDQAPVDYEIPKETIDDIAQLIQRFSVDNDFLKVGAIGDSSMLVPNLKENHQYKANRLFTTNFRSFCIDDNLEKFLDWWQVDEYDGVVAQTQDLIASIYLRYGDVVVNTLITRIYVAFDAMVAREYQTTPWTTVHARCPYLWALYMVQREMHRFSIR